MAVSAGIASSPEMADTVGEGAGAEAGEEDDDEAAKKLHWSPSRQLLEELIKAELKVAPPGSTVKTAAGVSQV